MERLMERGREKSREDVNGREWKGESKGGGRGCDVTSLFKNNKQFNQYYLRTR